jgi:hypothetical protein
MTKPVEWEVEDVTGCEPVIKRPSCSLCRFEDGRPVVGLADEEFGVVGLALVNEAYYEFSEPHMPHASFSGKICGDFDLLQHRAVCWT